jgi:tetratricopeptide (TPR) repeat protein
MCLWDIETTIEMELSNWGVPEVLRGYIPKHSNYFYQRRVEYTLPMLKEDPARFDDAAVAYDKLGKYPEAIALMEEKEGRFPGLYETYSNWGTFLTHAGNLNGGLSLLKKALEINPNAHFGREHYQISLIEYAIQSKIEASLIEKKDFLGIDLPRAEKELSKANEEPSLQKVGLKEDVFSALTALMRFGAADKHAGVWFSLGLSIAYGYPEGQFFSMQAMRRAEVLGHPRARRFAEILSGSVKELPKLTKPWYRRAEATYQNLIELFDEEFADGQAEVQQEQLNEDQQLQNGDTSLFGY